MTRKILGYAGWSIVGIAIVFFIAIAALPYLPYNQQKFASVGAWPQFAPSLLVHIVFGMVALVLGPFQFFGRIRKKYPRTHRTMGKIYLISVVIAGAASFFLSVGKMLIAEKNIVFGLGLFMLGVIWLLSSGMAYWAVRSRNFVQHREWMVRSFVTTCAFVTFRLFAKTLSEGFGVDFNIALQVMAWACWAVPLMVTEVFLQAAKIRKGNAALANKKRAGPVPVSEI
ncbi:MAG: DUF2306 domain-containing protein [Bacteroidetes bacterium]|nr:DUF2306 domain-containing protein [Bacteroidota bacterium]